MADMAHWLFLLDCCSRAYLSEKMKVQYRTVRKFDDKLLKQLNILDSECFPDKQDQQCIPNFRTGSTIVARKGEIMLGYGHLTDYGCIDRIGVRPDNRQQGLGKHILRSLVAAAKRRSFLNVLTYVARENAASLLLFLKSGFRPVGRVVGASWIWFERLL